MAATAPTIAEVMAAVEATVLDFTAFLSWMPPPKHRDHFARPLRDARAILAGPDRETQVIVDAETLARAIRDLETIDDLADGGPDPQPIAAAILAAVREQR
jgi:hypothetical protein